MHWSWLDLDGTKSALLQKVRMDSAVTLSAPPIFTLRFLPPLPDSTYGDEQLGIKEPISATFGAGQNVYAITR